MEYLVILERDPETGHWVAEIPGIDGAYSQGATKAEALRNVREALELVLEENGPPANYQVEFAKVVLEA